MCAHPNSHPRTQPPDPHCCSTHTTSSYPSAIAGKTHINNNEFTSSLCISIYGNFMGSSSCTVPVAASPLGSTSTQAEPTARGTGNYTGNPCPDNHQRCSTGWDPLSFFRSFSSKSPKITPWDLPPEFENLPSLILECNFRM